MSLERRSLLPGPLVWASGMVAIGLAIEALRDGEVAGIASAPLAALLAAALLRSRRAARA